MMEKRGKGFEEPEMCGRINLTCHSGKYI